MAQIGQLLERARDIGRDLADAAALLAGGARGPLQLSSPAVLEALPHDMRQVQPASWVRELVECALSSARVRWDELISQRINDETPPTIVGVFDRRRSGLGPNDLEQTSVVTKALDHYPAWATMDAEARAAARVMLQQIHTDACYLAATDDPKLRIASQMKKAEPFETADALAELVDTHRDAIAFASIEENADGN